ncbi:MAG: GNAT family N-acetyltransferase [Bacteroidetes bacterium]|nr:GNAT family N-acetyltransferase [Bacteroidota bacterium]
MKSNDARDPFAIRVAHPAEYKTLGQLIVSVYSQLEGFPKPDEHPEYYKLMANIGDLAAKPEVELIVSVNSDKTILGGVVYFGDIKYYGSGGIATKEKNAAGFRLLAVGKQVQQQGIGKLLINECIRKSREKKRSQLILHSTKVMQAAWPLYERLGFVRSQELDFLESDFTVFGFRLTL